MGGGNASFWLRLSASPHLVIVRDALTLTFPVIIAGAFAVLVNNFPVPSYQRFMEWFFGPNWKVLGAYMWGGTFAIIAPVTVCAIGYGVCNLYNKKHSLDTIHPLIVGLISFCSLMVLIEPLSEVFAIPYRWVGIHGLFLAIIVALISSELFLWFYKHNVRINFFLETPNAIMVNAFSSLLPGAMTIFVFAGFKAVMSYFKLNDLHELTYEMLCKPFVGMGNNLPSALVFMFARQFLWFLGIHGSNALEPVMTELYSSSSAANAIAMASGGAPPFVFTKTFFDSYVTMGGSGNTLSLLFAFFIARRWKKPGTVAKISILPAIFNINETLVFGVPIVLNPFYFVPFVATPMALTVTSYLAMRAGLVSVTMTEAAWTTPALVSGYVAAGNLTGSLLQVFNLAVGVAIYLPFVKIAERVQAMKFDATYKELLRISYSLEEDGGAALVNRDDDIGVLSRALANDLLLSLDRRELYLEYQPQVDCRDGRVCGVEALLRWKHERMGNVPPSLFIPLAEEAGFIKEIGLWVCNESCRQLRAWKDDGVDGVVMSFNLSVRQLDDPDLPEKIGSILRKWGVAPGEMKVEVTESTGLSSNMGHNVLLQDIKLTGLDIAIDDFGMGHTSLVYLKQFPVSTIKLDGSLVRDVTTSKISMDIISTISELCKSMGIQLLAEFVEAEAQAVKLKSLGCCTFQGYLYSPALDPVKCENAIRQGFRKY